MEYMGLTGAKPQQQETKKDPTLVLVNKDTLKGQKITYNPYYLCFNACKDEIIVFV